MSLTLNKKNSLRSDSFLFLSLQTHNFLTLFIRGGRVKSIGEGFLYNSVSMININPNNFDFPNDNIILATIKYYICIIF